MPQSFPQSQLTGWWAHQGNKPETGDQAIKSALLQVTKPVYLIRKDDQIAVSTDGEITVGKHPSSKSAGYPLYAYAPPLHPKTLGSRYFKTAHHLTYAYIAGEMANGITSAEIVEEMERAGMIGFFGSAGLSLDQIESAIDRLQKNLAHASFGFNLIHNPYNPDHELAVVKLYMKKGVRLISAAAFMNLTLPVVYFRVKGIRRDETGAVICPNKIIAKVSRVEVARKFFSPPPEKLLSQLVEMNLITKEEAALAETVPMADDLTAEADSGGHTDNRPALSLLPTMLALRDEMARTFNYKTPLHVGLAGGIATPHATAAAFAMGAAYVLTGSINQSCMESGTSEIVKKMLAEAGQADVAMAPSADMFEMGVKVQVLKRGTMFPIRAAKLYELYNQHGSFDELPEKERINLEKNFFHKPFEEEWEHTRNFFSTREPAQIVRAEQDPKHKMALVFRSYLGQSSGWAISGDPKRRIDYQIWCGPSIGAFNEWVKGSFLEHPENRNVVTVAMNLLFGAAFLTRINYIRNQGVMLPATAEQIQPLNMPEIAKLIED